MHAIENKESVPNAMDKALTLKMANLVINVKEDGGIGGIIEDLQAVLAKVIDL